VGAVFVTNFVRFLLIAFELLVIGRVLLSYVEPSGRSAFSQFLVGLTEPALAPIRRLLPKGGMFDFSPLIVILVLGAIIRALPGWREASASSGFPSASRPAQVATRSTESATASWSSGSPQRLPAVRRTKPCSGSWPTPPGSRVPRYDWRWV
jgi:YggT family protein